MMYLLCFSFVIFSLLMVRNAHFEIEPLCGSQVQNYELKHNMFELPTCCMIVGSPNVCVLMQSM